ncbi:MAG: 5-oxoprolinase subunit PxpB [Candidatus Limivivens sp.]|nr:5-oxoprolinase subunit PxpB [Candidatus Limivivens sp.]
MSQIRYLAVGDSALTVDFGNEISESVSARVQALQQRLEREKWAGVIETLPTFRSVLIYYDPLRISFGELCEKLKNLPDLNESSLRTSRRIFEIPVCYGARFGLDLHDAEKLTGLTADEIIALHSGRDYRIYMLGFLPGFPYLGGMDERLQMPRLQNPRTRIPAGSVGIGGTQTGIYPMDSPGGWRLIGMTPIRLYDPNREKPILYEAGDYIRFVPISIDDYYDIHRLAEAGAYECRVIEETEGGSRS